MANWWKLIVTEPNGHKKLFRFTEVGEAVRTAKEYRADGFGAEVISAGHGYAPTRKAGPRPSAKHYWCPYCIKWRIYQVLVVRMKGGLRSPDDMRCPICLISDHDYYVRKYNGLLGTADLEMVYKLENAFTRS